MQTQPVSPANRHRNPPEVVGGGGTQPIRPAVDPKKISAAIKMGNFYFERGEYLKAIDEFQQGLALDPSNLELRNLIAKAKRAKAAEDQLNQ